MKIAIIADCHLGVNKFRKMDKNGFLNMYSHLNDESFKEAIKIAKDNSDALIIAGDLFEFPNPNVRSINLAKEQLKFYEKDVYLLGGNHDYSQINKDINCHPFDLINEDNVHKFYEEGKVVKLNDNLKISFLPYKCLNAENYAKIYDFNDKDFIKNSQNKSILVFHGSLDLSNFVEEDTENEFSLDKEIAKNYNLVISGHVHLPRLLKTNSVSVLTPGSLMGSNQATQDSIRPSVYIYNTENNEIKRIELQTPPKIFNYITDDINKILENISSNENKDEFNNLYFIKYNGRVQDIDEYLYKRSIQKSLNLSIITNEVNNLEDEVIEKISDFWKYIEENYPDYEDEFKEFLKENY